MEKFEKILKEKLNSKFINNCLTLTPEMIVEACKEANIQWLTERKELLERSEEKGELTEYGRGGLGWVKELLTELEVKRH